MTRDRSRRTPDGKTLAGFYCDQYERGHLDDLQFVRNVGLVMDHLAWREHLFLQEIYLHALAVPGVVLDLGVHLGKDMAVFLNLRSIHEPANVTRRVVGFDTFSGFPRVAGADGLDEEAYVGQFSLAPTYVEDLRTVLTTHAYLGGLDAGCFELVQGDVVDTLPDYLVVTPVSSSGVRSRLRGR